MDNSLRGYSNWVSFYFDTYFIWFLCLGDWSINTINNNSSSSSSSSSFVQGGDYWPDLFDLSDVNALEQTIKMLVLFD